MVSSSSLVVSCRLSKAAAASCCCSRCVIAAFSQLALAGRLRELALPCSTGGSFASPRPPSNRSQQAGCSTVCSRRLYVPRRHSSSVLRARPCRAARRASSSALLRLLPALEGSPEQAQGCSRSSSLRSPSSPLQGGWESLFLFSQAASAAELPTPLELALAWLPVGEGESIALSSPSSSASCGLSRRTAQQAAPWKKPAGRCKPASSGPRKPALAGVSRLLAKGSRLWPV